VDKMDDEIGRILTKLSSKSVLKRKEAIKELKPHLHTQNEHIARLSLHYVAEHDPCYTVRNIARQASYSVTIPNESNSSWEKTFVFQSE
jgi:hypothetical protein